MLAEKVQDYSAHISPSEVCAGNISSKDAWQFLKSNEDTILVDVRTLPEWTFVGIPDLSSLGKETIILSWRIYPGMEINSDFENKLSKIISDKDTPILFICRSGGRSLDAAAAMTSKGYKNCFNISDGFEGPIDTKGHRCSIDGWKAANLPWKQS